ncbi:MAG: hypothetical protein LUD07_01680 [Clostridiales bacterium]|nr:hypothetical protein [Clostridiales bacterium]
MPTNENKTRYDIQYAKTKLKRIPLDVQKEKYEEIKTAASTAGETVNGYIKKAIDERISRDTGQPIIQETSESEQAKPSRTVLKAFTDEDAQRVDLPRLLRDFRYQFEIQDLYGKAVLSDLLTKARANH